MVPAISNSIANRPAEKAIRTSAPIEEPDVIVVFHSGLLAHPATVSGMKANGILIYAGHKDDVPEGLARLPKTTKIIRVDAQKIAFEDELGAIPRDIDRNVSENPQAAGRSGVQNALPLIEKDPLDEDLELDFWCQFSARVGEGRRVAITDAGRAMHQKISGYLVRREAELLDVLSDQERAALRKLLNKLAFHAAGLER